MTIHCLLLSILLNLNFYAVQEKNFIVRAGEIVLDSKISIGSISALDIDDKENLLITDRVGQQVLIFSKVYWFSGKRNFRLVK